MSLIAATDAAIAQVSVAGVRVVTVADGLADPWAIAVLPDLDILVTEKAGRLRLVRDGKLQAEPVAGVPRVRVGGQGGLIDLVLAPDFADSRYVYVTIAKPSPDDSLGTTAGMRARFDGSSVGEVTTVVEGPGRIRDVHEGPDGYVYPAITAGEVATTPIVRLEPVE